MTKSELDEKWSVLDLLDCHVLMDIHEELDRLAEKRRKDRDK